MAVEHTHTQNVPIFNPKFNNLCDRIYLAKMYGNSVAININSNALDKVREWNALRRLDQNKDGTQTGDPSRFSTSSCYLHRKQFLVNVSLYIKCIYIYQIRAYDTIGI